METRSPVTKSVVPDPMIVKTWWLEEVVSWISEHPNEKTGNFEL